MTRAEFNSLAVDSLVHLPPLDEYRGIIEDSFWVILDRDPSDFPYLYRPLLLVAGKHQLSIPGDVVRVHENSPFVSGLILL